MLTPLLKPEYRGKVALNGDPTQAGTAFSGVMMVALSQGGSADDIAPGVEFFTKLKDAGNFLPVDPTPATVESGQTPVVIDWDYLNAAETKKLPTWNVVVPRDRRSPATTSRRVCVRGVMVREAAALSASHRGEGTYSPWSRASQPPTWRAG